jgi:hypothetical protein
MTIGVGGGQSSKDAPALGQFLSPDTLVPDAGLVLDDNRCRQSSVVRRHRTDNPALGQFLSPDTLVPDAGLVLDDNRGRQSSVVRRQRTTPR